MLCTVLVALCVMPVQLDIHPAAVAAHRPWQSWADRMLMPPAPGVVHLFEDYCRAGTQGPVRACYDAAALAPSNQPRSVWVKGDPRGFMADTERTEIRDAVNSDRWTLYHELGHDFDLRVMTDAHRSGFQRIVGGNGPNNTLDWWSRAQPFDAAWGEWFAQAYALAALRTKYVDDRDGTLTFGYGYETNNRKHRRVRALIQRAARAAGIPVP